MLRRFVSACLVTGCAVVVAAACSSSSSSGPSGPAGGPVTGADDTHCAGKKQQTNDTACHPSLDAGVDDATSDAAPDVGGTSEYGPTLFNAQGFDDDCKYQVSWTSDPIYRDTNVTFHLSAMKTFDGVWACGANPYVEAFLDETHPAPNSDPHTSEVGTGKYDIGPIRFDAPGRWTVRFHLYGDCSDLTPDSPHGHAAFFVQVP